MLGIFLLTMLIMASGFVAFTYTAESYPTRMRNTATGFHNALARLAVAGIQPIIPMIFKSYSFSGVYYFFVILTLIPVFIVGPWGQRTGGKSLEEIS